MKLVLLCRVAPPRAGGMEAVLGGLARVARTAGHDCRIVTVDPGLPMDDLARLPRVGSRRWPFARGLGGALAGADLVHVHGVDGLFDQALSLSNAPVALSTHGAFFHGDASLGKRAWARTWCTLRMRAAAQVWFTSAADRRWFGAIPRSTVLGNGLDLTAWRARAGRPRDPALWVVPGRVVPHKRAIDVLEPARIAGARVVVAGPTPDVRWAAVVAARAAALRVPLRFSGEITTTELQDLVSAAGTVWFPSRAEGFGLGLVEALATGARCVARPILAFRELAGEGAVHFDAFDDPARTAARAAVPIDPAAAVAAAARWDWTAMGPRWLAAWSAAAR